MFRPPASISPSGRWPMTPLGAASSGACRLASGTSSIGGSLSMRRGREGSVWRGIWTIRNPSSGHGPWRGKLMSTPCPPWRTLSARWRPSDRGGPCTSRVCGGAPSWAPGCPIPRNLRSSLPRFPCSRADGCSEATHPARPCVGNRPAMRPARRSRGSRRRPAASRRSEHARSRHTAHCRPRPTRRAPRTSARKL